MMGLWEEDCRGKVPFSSLHIKATYNQCDISLLMFISISWLRYCVSGCPPVKLEIFFFREVMFQDEL